MSKLGPRTTLQSSAMAVAVAIMIGACGGGDTGRDQPQRDAAPATPAPGTPAPGAPAAPGGGTAAQIALGQQIFTGQAAGGTCYTCHAMDGTGTAIGPSLADGQWIHGDGSMDFLVRMVTQGVPQPKEYPAPMPPFGGSPPLNADQTRAVAAYVYSLSHPQGS